MLQRNEALPFYAQVKQILRDQIAAGEYRADMPVPDERTLASKLGISNVTVRRALVELTSEGLLKRVRGRGTFVRGSFAPQRRSRRINIALVMPFNFESPLDPFYYRLLHGVHVACENNGYLLAYRGIRRPHKAFFEELKRDSSIKAVIATGIAETEIFEGLSGLNLPVVLLDCAHPEGATLFDEVYHSAEDACFKAVASLLQHGHRDIAIFQSLGINSLNVQRQNGYQRALAAYGVPVRQDLDYHMPFCADAAYQRMTELLKSGRVPTAVFCTGDELAAAVITAALEHGLRVPRDLSVIGFADILSFCSPPLSTIRVHLEQMGQAAVKVLHERLAAPTAPIKRIEIPADWLPRASVAPPRKSLVLNEQIVERSILSGEARS